MKLKIHPLFIILGLVLCIFNYWLNFLIYVLTIILHEFAHSFVAGKLGYRLNTLSLLPQGAQIYGVQSFRRYSDEITIAIAGPALNLLLAIFCISMWWLFPETYFLTELFVYSNLFICGLNLVPVMPLDGGRITLAIFSKYKNRKKGIFVTNFLGIAFSLVLLGLFIFSIFNIVNFTFLIFAIFLVVGVLDNKREYQYNNVFSEMLRNINLTKGVDTNQFVLSEKASLLKLLKNLNARKYNICLIANEFGEIVARIHQPEIEELLTKQDVTHKLYEMI